MPPALALPMTRASVLSGVSLAPLAALTDLPNLTMLLSGDAGETTDTAGTTPATTDGAVVARWNDQSGNGNNATQSTAGRNPTLKLATLNGHNTVLGDATDDTLVLSAAVNAVLMSATKTVFMVVIPQTVRNSATALVAANAGSSTRFRISTTAAGNYEFVYSTGSGAVVLNSGVPLVASVPALLTVVQSGSSFFALINGAAVASASNAAADTAGTIASILANTGSAPCNWHIACLAIYSDAKSSADRQRAERLLKATYGL